MLVELAIADAYGAGFEFRNGFYIRTFNRLDRYHRPALSLAKPGRYSDDTQMTLAITEALLSGELWSPDLIADSFVRVFKRDPRGGYAPRFGRFLQRVTDGDDFLARIRPQSDRSGAAMRAGPIGLIANVEELLWCAELQARVTHDTPGGVSSSMAAALMVHYFFYKIGAPDRLAEFVAEYVPGPWRMPWKGRVSMNGVDCVSAALTAVSRHRSLAELLRGCVDLGGDVDTVATIALASASWSVDYDNDIPTVLIEGLESGPFGIDYLKELDQQIMTLVW
ncbi:MAG: ADP-ribosylglycohydrolase family protein [Microthrixaceae bacterium]|jgi:ADP-ribosyl-[dinitrogen reductase] hydrolase|nr:ADP-ribosylglycohydrolase family protein [Microthrixaceae bacterium]